MAPQRRNRASAASASEPQQLSSPPITPAPAPKGKTRGQKPPSSKKIKKEALEDEPEPVKTPRNSRKRTRAETPDENEKVLDELPHGLGPIPTPDASDSTTKVKDEKSSPPKKRAKRSPKAKVKSDAEDAADVKTSDLKTEQADESESATPVKAKAKKNKYGFMPGQTPYPDWPHPTTEECYEVDRILSKVHGKVKPPEVIPVPAVTVAGCGEVPSVLDALIRTRLSAATTNTNSSRAFQGLVKTFGTIKEGIGKGSVDWNKVRLASQPEVFDAIKIGGLAQVKSKDIKSILEMTYQENQARRAALKSETEDSPAGAENEVPSEKESEIARAESSVLSLDHYHSMETQEAIDRMCEFPGIGMKTAACVALFCLRRSCFAVDTHVFRLCQYLNWVPPPDDVQPGQPKVGRNTTYTHCEARVPDELKYSLHQLLIKHGKTCSRCRAATTTSSAEWSKGCPIEHLVHRFELKKNGAGGAVATPNGKTTKGTPKSTKSGGRKRQASVESEEAESSDLSEEADSELEDAPPPKRTPRKRAAKVAATTPKNKGRRAKDVEESEDQESSTGVSDLSSEFEDE